MRKRKRRSLLGILGMMGDEQRKVKSPDVMKTKDSHSVNLFENYKNEEDKFTNSLIALLKLLEKENKKITFDFFLVSLNRS